MFDPAAGRLVRQEMSMKLKGSVTTDAMGQPITMFLTQDGTVKARVLDRNPAEK